MKGLLGKYVLAAAALAALSGQAWAGSFTAGPGIENASILRSRASSDIHISQSITLQAYGRDADTYSDGCGSADYYDYIDLPATTWSCSIPGYISSTGPCRNVTFNPGCDGNAGDSPVVTAVIKDKTNAGADDEDDVNAYAYFEIFQVGCVMDVLIQGEAMGLQHWHQGVVMEQDGDGDASTTVAHSGHFDAGLKDGDSEIVQVLYSPISCFGELDYDPNYPLDYNYSYWSANDPNSRVDANIYHHNAESLSGWCYDNDGDNSSGYNVWALVSTGAGWAADVNHGSTNIDPNETDPEFGAMAGGSAYSSDDCGSYLGIHYDPNDPNSEYRVSSEVGPTTDSDANSYESWGTCHLAVDGNSKGRFICDETGWGTEVEGGTLRAGTTITVAVTDTITDRPIYVPGAMAADPNYVAP